MNEARHSNPIQSPKNALILRFAQQVARQHQPSLVHRLHGSMNELEFAGLLNEIGLHLLSTHFGWPDSERRVSRG